MLTGIDLPPNSLGGSLELLRDVYANAPGVTVATLANTSGVTVPRNWHPLSLTLADRSDALYRKKLGAELRAAFGSTIPIVHCQHLIYGMTDALLSTYPRAHSVGVCHGTDVIEAEFSDSSARELRFNLERLDEVVFPTFEMRDRVQRLLGADPLPPSHIVPWGLDASLIKSTGSGVSRASSTVLYAGRSSPEKGLREFLEMSPLFPNEWHVKVAAPYDDTITLVNSLGLPANSLTVLGWLPRQQLWKQLAECTVLVVPSTRLEAFGITAVEAAIAGAGVAYSRVGGLTEVLGDHLGVGFELGNTRSMVDAITNRMALDESARVRISTEASILYSLEECRRTLLSL